ncbi:NMD3-domain-containing protein, partial [Zopfochytrium polystomum]
MEFVTLSLPEQQLQQQQHQQQPQLISQLSQQQQQQLSQQRILCASCGAVIAPNAANLCINCIRNDVDITEGIPKQAILNYCKGCDRYLQPPNIWELLTICLKKLKSGLAKVRLVDAGFIWTEPHSKRVFASTILQQVFVVEYVVSNQQCEECTRAVVQRPRTVSTFYYINRAHAVRMVEFLREMVPMRLKTSEQLISQDIHSGSANYRFSYSIEIVPICKDDLVCLPVKLARASSDISPLVLCSRVSNSLGLIDFNTLKSVDVRSTFVLGPALHSALARAKDLVEFFVIDVQQERAPNASNRFLARDGGDIAPSQGSEITLAGYDLRNANFNDAHFDAYVRRSNGPGPPTRGPARRGAPTSVLVRKSYPNARKRSKKQGRSWKLKKITVEEEVEARWGRARRRRDLEEDPDCEACWRRRPEEDFPEIDETELLDELMDGMTLEDTPGR